MRAEVYRFARDASLFIVIPKGAPLPARVRVSASLEIGANEWQFSRDLDIDPTKTYVGLDAATAIDDLSRQRWHLGTSGDSSR